MDNTKKILLGSVVFGIVFILAMVGLASTTREPIRLPIKLTEYSDFECPACKAYSDAVNELKNDEKYKGKLEVVYKHFPLVTIHQYAYNAALASEAAREQGKFDEYHDILFKNQDALDDASLIKYAKDLGLDTAKFENDFKNNQAVKSRVDNDIKEGNDLGINSTPTFYINGKKASVSNPDGLVTMIDRYIARAK